MLRVLRVLEIVVICSMILLIFLWWLGRLFSLKVVVWFCCMMRCSFSVGRSSRF